MAVGKYILVLIFSFMSLSSAINFKLLDDDVMQKWNEWKVTFGKVYNSPEVEQKHLGHFIDNIKYIENHKRRVKRSTLGMTKFADQPDGSPSGGCTFKVNVTKERSDVNATSVPDSLDLRSKGYVTPIKYQENCGSCWAFGTIGAVEAQNFRASKGLVSLSEQQLVDCSQSNDGCDGGNPILAYHDIILSFAPSGKVATNASYLYTAIQGKCKRAQATSAAKIIDYDVLEQDENEIKEAVATIGPLAVTIDTQNLGIHSTGIFDDPECYWDLNNITDRLHSVLIIGYGRENGADYWLIKNSWGSDWGENGYFKMARNKNRCGISTTATFPMVEGVSYPTIRSTSPTKTPQAKNPISTGVKETPGLLCYIAYVSIFIFLQY